MKTYFTYGILFFGGTGVAVKAHKVMSGQNILTFLTKDGVKQFEWDRIMGFLEDDGQPRGDLMEEIFEKPAKHDSVRRFGRMRFYTMTMPPRLAGEAWYSKLPPLGKRKRSQC